MKKNLSASALLRSILLRKMERRDGEAERKIISRKKVFMKQLGLHSKRVLLGEKLQEATLVLAEGKIADIFKGPLQPHDFLVTDEGNAVIMPGLIDAHVHINEPGRTVWEGFNTATRAAAAGGITTLVDMPLNSSPVTTDVKAFEKKLAATEGQLHVNCGFWGGVVPQNIDQLEALMGGGVLGIKAFLTHSGIDDFPNVTEADLRKALPQLKKHNLPLLIHAELTSPHAEQYLLEQQPTSYQAYLKSRPKYWEDDAIEMMIRLCREFDTHIHIVHLSSSNSIKAIRQAQVAGLPITVETCPQYLYFHAEAIPDGQTQFKCAPPIREQANNNLLWQALQEGFFNFIASDHSPAPPEIKELDSGNFQNAWGGIAGLQFNLPVIWTKAKEKGFSIADISRLMSGQVASFLKLDDRKGRLAKGFDADIMVWEPETSFEVTSEMIHFRHKVSPYLGERLYGLVRKTFVGGQLVYNHGTFNQLGQGKILKR